ncbi:MAG: CRISPR-associated endoribonuclease Cas6 [Candidatus Nanoarchaeia archaeon]|nr:CRISPR-associated endoribonuclease Cas6 [Candidatus Jingweiarchaeum tengchongense]
MRLLVKLKSRGNYSYDPSINHKIQGFIYDNLKTSFFEWLHKKEGAKYFCFSNIFPIGDIKKNSEVNLIISSQISELIDVLKERIPLNTRINIGEYSFEPLSLNEIKLNLGSRIDLITATPIVIRIPKSRYKEYKIRSKRPYEYWKKTMPLNIFIDGIETNFTKKYNSFFGINMERIKLFEKYEFKKEVSVIVKQTKGDSIIVGSLWKFSTVFIEKDKLPIFRFLIDTGLGEMNSEGFGFLNISKKV